MLLQDARWTDVLSLVTLQGLLFFAVPSPLNLVLAVCVALIVFLVGGDQRRRKSTPCVPPESAREAQLQTEIELLREKLDAAITEHNEWRERVIGHGPPSRSPSPRKQPTCSTTSPRRRTTRSWRPAPLTQLPR